MKKLFIFLSISALLVTLANAGFGGVEDGTQTMLAGVTLVPAITRDPANGNPMPTFTRAQKALFEYLQRKGQAQTDAALKSGALVFDPITYYIRYNITGLSGRQQIVSESTTKQVGVTNIDRGLLRQYYNFCLDKITVRYASANVVTFNTVQSIAGYSSVLSSMDPALRNGELVVIQNKNTIIETPIIDFGSAAAPTGGGARDFDGGDLQTPKVLEENKQLELWLSLGGTVASATNTIYVVEVALQGVQARIDN